MKERAHGGIHLFGHPARIRACVGTGDAAVYAIDDGPHHCMIGRRVGATTDGCVYSLVARVDLATWQALESGAIDGPGQAFLAAHDAGLSGTVETDGVSNVFDVDWYEYPEEIPERVPAAGTVRRLRRGPAHRRPVGGVGPGAVSRGPRPWPRTPRRRRPQRGPSGPGTSSERDDAGQHRARRHTRRTAAPRPRPVPPWAPTPGARITPPSPAEIEGGRRPGGADHRTHRAGDRQPAAVERRRSPPAAGPRPPGRAPPPGPPCGPPGAPDPPGWSCAPPRSRPGHRPPPGRRRAAERRVPR